MTVNELIKKTPLDVLGVAHIVASQIQDTSTMSGQIRQIAETNKQISQLLNTLSAVPINQLLTTIGTQGNAANLLALSSLQQTGALDDVTDIVSALSVSDNDNMVLFPAGRKTKKGLQGLVGALETVVDLVPLSSAAKLAIKGVGGYVVSALIEFAPEIGELVFEGFRAIEYELIELAVDKIFRDNAQPGDNCCFDMLETVKRALLTPDGSPLINGVTQALRAGLLDYARNTTNDETNDPVNAVDGVPVTLDNLPLIDKLIKSLTTPVRLDGEPVDINNYVKTNGVQIKRTTEESKALWQTYTILDKALLKYKRDAEGNIIEFDGTPLTESRIPERLEEYVLTAFLKQSKDSDGQPITDSQGRPVYESVFGNNTLDLSILKQALLKPITDSQGQPILDGDGNKTYGDSYLLDIVDELSQTTEVWTLDGVRLFLRDRLIEYT